MSDEQIEGLFMFFAVAGSAGIVMCIGGSVAVVIGWIIDKRNNEKL